MQRNKLVSDSPGVDFSIRLVNSVINLPDGQVKFFEEFKLQRNCEINLLFETFWGLVEMMFGLVNVSFSVPEWLAVKVTFFAPCVGTGWSYYQGRVKFHELNVVMKNTPYIAFTLLEQLFSLENNQNILKTT